MYRTILRVDLSLKICGKQTLNNLRNAYPSILITFFASRISQLNSERSRLETLVIQHSCVGCSSCTKRLEQIPSWNKPLFLFRPFFGRTFIIYFLPCLLQASLKDFKKWSFINFVVSGSLDIRTDLYTAFPYPIWVILASLFLWLLLLHTEVLNFRLYFSFKVRCLSIVAKTTGIICI